MPAGDMRRLVHLLLILALAAPTPAITAVPRQATQEMTVQRITVVSGNGRYRHLDQLPDLANAARAADDRLDSVARAAIASFRRAAGLPVDGMVSIELLVALANGLGGGPSAEGREL
jgi:peptidoglycan hydrolase-like protein with peptidoglycan-binding domain